MINFKDKKILITGATGGIGKEIVRKFVSLDGNVLATGTKIENLEKLKKEFPTVKILKFDISDHDKIEEFIENEEEKIEIIATLVVENSRHKGVVIGKNGSMIKLIGISARREIEKMLESSVNLQTFVKVNEDWRNDNNQLKKFGYKL